MPQIYRGNGNYCNTVLRLSGRLPVFTKFLAGSIPSPGGMPEGRGGIPFFRRGDSQTIPFRRRGIYSAIALGSDNLVQHRILKNAPPPGESPDRHCSGCATKQSIRRPIDAPKQLTTPHGLLRFARNDGRGTIGARAPRPLSPSDFSPLPLAGEGPGERVSKLPHDERRPFRRKRPTRKARGAWFSSSLGVPRP
jgi:hypothetical protein